LCSKLECSETLSTPGSRHPWASVDFCASVEENLDQLRVVMLDIGMNRSQASIQESDLPDPDSFSN
jgi:hypothetical protein